MSEVLRDGFAMPNTVQDLVVSIGDTSEGWVSHNGAQMEPANHVDLIIVGWVRSNQVFFDMEPLVVDNFQGSNLTSWSAVPLSVYMSRHPEYKGQEVQIGLRP
jgi:hypothetical protein